MTAKCTHFRNGTHVAEHATICCAGRRTCIVDWYGAKVCQLTSTWIPDSAAIVMSFENTSRSEYTPAGRVMLVPGCAAAMASWMLLYRVPPICAHWPFLRDAAALRALPIQSIHEWYCSAIGSSLLHCYGQKLPTQGCMSGPQSEALEAANPETRGSNRQVVVRSRLCIACRVNLALTCAT